MVQLQSSKGAQAKDAAEDAEEAEWMANARKRLGVAEMPGSEQKRPRKTGW